MGKSAVQLHKERRIIKKYFNYSAVLQVSVDSGWGAAE